MRKHDEPDGAAGTPPWACTLDTPPRPMQTMDRPRRCEHLESGYAHKHPGKHRAEKLRTKAS